jgi:hypothetical protein
MASPFYHRIEADAVESTAERDKQAQKKRMAEKGSKYGMATAGIITNIVTIGAKMRWFPANFASFHVFRP